MKKVLTIEPLAFAAIFWLVYLADFIIPGSLTSWGIRPREVSGLIGIAFSPFLHGSLFHIVSNTIPFLILGFVVRAYGKLIFWEVTLLVLMLGGLFTWLFSSAGTVVGVSGIIFGYWSFAIVYGLLKRSIKSIVLSLFVIIFYGTMVFSFLSFYPNVSWAGHLGGAIAGVLCAVLLSKVKMKSPP